MFKRLVVPAVTARISFALLDIVGHSTTLRGDSGCGLPASPTRMASHSTDWSVFRPAHSLSQFGTSYPSPGLRPSASMALRMCPGRSL